MDNISVVLTHMRRFALNIICVNFIFLTHMGYSFIRERLTCSSICVKFLKQ
ncbi:MAG TPA: hypothetical protein PLI57_10760 [Spirochaetota bacterium]|nr:MAG: hypothetical protein BWX91_00064 [Spirochaetes bacterium ADurb.Bin133]HQJ06844.1 hypothetical protein [Spirochaetota bacterium]